MEAFAQFIPAILLVLGLWLYIRSQNRTSGSTSDKNDKSDRPPSPTRAQTPAHDHGSDVNTDDAIAADFQHLEKKYPKRSPFSIGDRLLQTDIHCHGTIEFKETVKDYRVKQSEASEINPDASLKSLIDETRHDQLDTFFKNTSVADLALSSLGERTVYKKVLKCTHVACDKCTGIGKLTCPACNGKKQVPCESCNGTGKRSRDQTVTTYPPCPSCGGIGIHQTAMLGGGIDSRTCNSCGGSGKSRLGNTQTYKGRKCKTCKGKKELPCTSCKKTGLIPCNKCDGRGKLAEVERYTMTVTIKRRFDIPRELKHYHGFFVRTLENEMTPETGYPVEDHNSYPRYEVRWDFPVDVCKVRAKDSVFPLAVFEKNRQVLVVRKPSLFEWITEQFQ